MDCTAEHPAQVRRNGRHLVEMMDAEEQFLPAPLVAGRYHCSNITLELAPTTHGWGSRG